MFRRPKSDETDDSPDRLSVRGVMIERVTGENRLDEFHYEPDPYWRGRDELANLLSEYGHTTSSLERLAMTLTAGKSWYGTPVESRAGPLANFAHCLLTYGMRRVLDPWFLGARGEGDAGECARLEAAGKVVTVSELEEMAQGGNANLFLDAMASACVGRCLFTTASGMQGVGPLATSPGDMVAVINGTPMPFVIRYSEEKQGYELLGECYIDGFMHGEAFDGSKYKECWIDLV
jgi:hypothetical protein